MLVGTVALLATGLVPPAIAGLLAATAMVMLRVVGVPQAYRAVSWQTVVLVGGLIPLSVAIASSGAADLVARLARRHRRRSAARTLILAAIFVLTVLLGQVVSNTATVLIVAPIAVAACGNESGCRAQPPCSCSSPSPGPRRFLTPIATPANMMVMGAGGYRFSDYWKLGLATTLAWFVVAVLLIPVIWPT